MCDSCVGCKPGNVPLPWRERPSDLLIFGSTLAEWSWAIGHSCGSRTPGAFGPATVVCGALGRQGNMDPFYVLDSCLHGNALLAQLYFARHTLAE